MKNALDIETIPNGAMVEFLEPVEAPAKYKDPAKIQEYIKEKQEKQIGDMAKKPFTGRICSYAMHGESEDFFRVIPEISDAAEIELVTDILEKLKIGDSEPNTLITWNGYNFDFPYIYKRAMILKIALPAGCPPLRWWVKKYACECHIDLMQELAGWQIENIISLDRAGKLFLGSGKTERDYQTYIELIKSGEGNKIGLDNLNDSQHTYQIYKILEPYLF
jgi:DNA polymerase elongation subunit (family B)